MLLSPTCSRTFRLLIREYFRASGYHSRRCVSVLSSSSQLHNHEECDVVIVGGGLAGLALASALGSSPLIREHLRVTLVEAGDLSKVREWAPPIGTFSNRVSSLTNASQSFLKEIGAWSNVEARRTCPIEAMQVWDGVSDARITFTASELDIDTPEAGMARLTENLNLQRGILQHLDGFPEVQVLDKTKVSSIVRDQGESGNWPLVHLDNGRILKGRLLVGADGFNSPVRSYAQIPSYGWAYDTQAIVATLFHPPRGAFQGPNTTAYQRFLPTGPIAFLPLSPTTSSLVWSTKPRLAAALIASEPPVLTSMINAAFRLPEVSMRYLNDLILEAHTAGTPMTYAQIKDEIFWRERSHAIDQHSAYTSASINASAAEMVGVPPADSESLPPLVTSIQSGTIASFPLRFNHTESYIGEGHGSRTVLVGDAAHTVHPLAGQGLNMGLADVECLARCIHEAILQGGDVGSYTALLPYAKARYFENHKIMAAMDKLHKIYSSTYEPLVWARSVGLEVLNEFDSLKATIMMSAGAHDGGNRNTWTGATGWSLVARGVGSLATSSDAARVIAGIVGTGLHRFSKVAVPSQDQDK